MEFGGSEYMHASKVEVFNFITDAKHFSSGIPDIQSIRMAGPDKFSVTARLGISAIRSTFDIDFESIERKESNHVKLLGHGMGGGSALDLEITIDLQEQGSDTVLKWTTVVRVSGTLAVLGQRVLGAVADRFVNEVFARIRAGLETSDAHD